MGITNISGKIVDSVHAAYAIRNTQGVIPGSLEYPWYLPYNLFLNELFFDSKHIMVNSQHWIEYGLSKKKGKVIIKKLIPDYVLLHVLSSVERGAIRVTKKILTVIEIKSLTVEISKDVEKGPAEDLRLADAHFNEATEQAILQAQVALLSSEQRVIFAIICVGPYWTYQIFRWQNNEKKNGRPVLSEQYGPDHPVCKLIDIDNNRVYSKKSEQLAKMFKQDFQKHFGTEFL